MRLQFATPTAGLFLLAWLSLSGCGLLEKEASAPLVVHLSLHDTLSRYDSVRVDIADGADTGKVIRTVHQGPLPDPSRVPACTLTASTDNFLVRVRGYRGRGQLGLETLIFYKDGKKAVVHRELPALVPYNWLARLTPSEGYLEPAFNSDVFSYQVVLPAGTRSVSFEAIAAYSGKAVVVVDGDTARPGTPAKIFPVDTAAVLVPITVTDLGTTRIYQVVVGPAKSAKVEIVRMEVSPGATVDPVFKPETQNYNVTIPAGAGFVEIAFWPADPGTMTLIIMGVPTFAGTKKRIDLAPGASTVLTVNVSKGGVYKEYALFISRAK